MSLCALLAVYIDELGYFLLKIQFGGNVCPRLSAGLEIVPDCDRQRGQATKGISSVN